MDKSPSGRAEMLKAQLLSDSHSTVLAGFSLPGKARAKQE